MSVSKPRDRHSSLMAHLDADAPEGAEPMGGARSDGAVPAIAMAGSLIREELQSAREQISTLEQQLREALVHDGSRDLDPALIGHSRFRDRHELGFQDAEFEALKASIIHDKGNHQPILVRPVADGASEKQFEVVWGHRRHRACLMAGLPVRALVRELSDREAVLLMSSENSQRKDLSQFEQARKYQTWLTAGLFSSQREIADAEGVDKATISRYLVINELPGAVVDRIEDPRTITGLWATKFMQLVGVDGTVLEKLEALPAGKAYTPKALMATLAPVAKPDPVDYRVGEQPVFQAIPEASKGGGIRWSTLKLYRDLDADQMARLAEFVQTL